MKICAHATIILLSTMLISFSSFSAFAVQIITFTEKSNFRKWSGQTLVDNYTDPGYQHGDLGDLTFADSFSNERMSAVTGLARYQSTAPYGENHIVDHQTTGTYCHGCNGSFLIGFSNTPLKEVRAVGLDMYYNVLADDATAYDPVDPEQIDRYISHVVFENGEAIDIRLPSVFVQTRNLLFPLYEEGLPSDFFGFVSDIPISSVHFGLPNGLSTERSAFILDNLILGKGIGRPIAKSKSNAIVQETFSFTESAEAQEIPEPAPFIMIMTILAVLGLTSRWTWRWSQ